jgi:hypothetical protein
MTDWADHAIWWQVYPLGFLGAEASALPPDAPPVPRLRALEPWLDYLIELGCNGFALGPIFASETHGTTRLITTASTPAWARRMTFAG